MGLLICGKEFSVAGVAIVTRKNMLEMKQAYLIPSRDRDHVVNQKGIRIIRR